jgi:hypothetical protein
VRTNLIWSTSRWLGTGIGERSKRPRPRLT